MFRFKLSWCKSFTGVGHSEVVESKAKDAIIDLVSSVMFPVKMPGMNSCTVSAKLTDVRMLLCCAPGLRYAMFGIVSKSFFLCVCFFSSIAFSLFLAEVARHLCAFFLFYSRTLF